MTLRRRCLTPLVGFVPRGARFVAVLAGIGCVLATEAPAAQAPGRMLVTATEFRFALSRAALPTGPALLQLSNRGEDPHDLVLRRLDGRGREVGGRRALGEVQPEGTGTLPAALKRGRYVLFCSLPGHRRLGMQARFTARG